MLVAKIEPSGVPISRPPAKGAPPSTLWQATQSVSRVTYSACSTGLTAPASATPSNGDEGMRVTYHAPIATMIRTMTAETASFFTSSP